ncbi:MAG TPA: hypothetical protein VJU86_08800 [Pyrinomonadaceae bacterium]|nr:hypothetical protein [Pyrinomonadaceae bacterium]
MSTMQLRFIVSLITIAFVSILSACEYNFALSPKQGLPLDKALIGFWQTQSGDKLEIYRKNQTEYSVVMDSSRFSAYPINIGNQTLLQVVKETKENRPYRLVSYFLRGNQLTVRYVRNPAQNQLELRRAILANGADLYGDVGVFTKTNITASTLTPSSFSAKGLNNEKTLTNLYLGQFNEIPFKRDNSGFGILFGEYVNSYSRQCAAYLPSNKVEITEQKCARERITKNGWGVEISRSCTEWVSVGTGYYADPKMYETKLFLDRFQTVQGIRTFIDIFTNPEKALGDTLGMVGNIMDAKSDMNNLVRMNSCSSPGLKRFQENLNLFALNGSPIVLTSPAPISNFPRAGFPLPPLITGNWETPDAQRVENLVTLLVKNAPVDLKGVARRITRLRVKRLPFYSGATLCEGLVDAADPQRMATVTFIALPNGSVTLLNGKSTPIHELNKRVPLAIDTKERAEDYFRFFFSAVFGEEGSFRIVEGEENISWTQNATVMDLQKVVNDLRPLKTAKLNDGRWRGTATVQYSNTIFNLVFYARPTGEIQMTEDKPIATDLPLRREKYDGYLRREVN